METIKLLGNVEFPMDSLVNYLKGINRFYIIQGQSKCKFTEHTKPNSLDYWLRNNFAKNKDTMQATNDVINQLIQTRIFVLDTLICPDSNRKCKGIKYIG